jgi:hypothetical protein
LTVNPIADMNPTFGVVGAPAPGIRHPHAQATGQDPQHRHGRAVGDRGVPPDIGEQALDLRRAARPVELIALQEVGLLVPE